MEKDEFILQFNCVSKISSVFRIRKCEPLIESHDKHKVFDQNSSHFIKVRINKKSRKKNNLLNIELKKLIEIMKLYPQKRVSAIGLISMTESQDVYLSFFLTLGCMQQGEFNFY